MFFLEEKKLLTYLMLSMAPLFTVGGAAITCRLHILKAKKYRDSFIFCLKSHIFLINEDGTLLRKIILAGFQVNVYIRPCQEDTAVRGLTWLIMHPPPP